MVSGADPGLQVRWGGGGGAHLKILRRAEWGAKIVGVFRVKNHDFTPKNQIFSKCRGRCENCWGISCEKSRFYAKKSDFSNFRGGRARCAPPPPPLDPPLGFVTFFTAIYNKIKLTVLLISWFKIILHLTQLVINDWQSVPFTSHKIINGSHRKKHKTLDLTI